MTDRWPTFHEPALGWIDRVQEAILARQPPDQGAFMAITNAIEYQFQNGADPETARLLIAALASSSGVTPQEIGIEADPQAVLAKLRPTGQRPR